jgi:hypothetical protein
MLLVFLFHYLPLNVQRPVPASAGESVLRVPMAHAAPNQLMGIMSTRSRAVTTRSSHLGGFSQELLQGGPCRRTIRYRSDRVSAIDGIIAPS